MKKSREISAKFNSRCQNCGGPITRGETILWTQGQKGAKHINCREGNGPKSFIKKKPENKEKVEISNINPSYYQQNVFDSIMNKNDKNNLIIEAVAGSGKTWTITQAVYRLLLSEEYKGQTALILAFNRHITKELEPKFPNDQVLVKTSNGFGLSLLLKAWKYNYPRPRMNARKTWKIFTEKCYDFKNMDSEEKSHINKMFWSLNQIISLAKGHGIKNEKELIKEWRDLANKFGIDLPKEEKYPEFESVLTQAYGISIRDKSMIDYDDMLLFPVLYQDEMEFPTYPFVFVDEAQDLNPIQIEMLKILNKKGSRIICVGDTHQAIYGFRGADPNSMKNIKTSLNCIEKPLSINYRCPKTVIELAKEIVPHIKAHKGAPQGEIIKDVLENLYTIAKEEDYILCRTMAPLVRSCMQFISLGEKATVLGRSIGEELANLVDKIANGKGDNCSIEDFICLVEDWESEEYKKINKNKTYNKESKMIMIKDKVDTLKALSKGNKIVKNIYGRINAIFTDTKKKGITLSTIHRCKGLENDRIIIIYPHLLPHPMAKQPWEQDQEKNLEYVAITRAKKTLIFLEGEHKKEEDCD